MADGSGYDRRTRKLLHLALGFPALGLPFITHNLAMAVVICGVLFTFWLRADRFSFVSRLAKPADHRSNHVTGFQVYAITILILVALVPLLDGNEFQGVRFAMLGWLVMAWGDGLSGLLGPSPRVARTVPWNHDKTLLGSLGALLGSMAAGMVSFGIPLDGLQALPLMDALRISAFVAVVATALESLQLGIDDNFTVGIGSVLTAILIVGQS